MKIIVVCIALLLHSYSIAFENSKEKNQVLQFFWNEDNSLLNIYDHFYIRNLANSISKTDYDFFILDNQQVNAFATEYGLIGINTGLINLTTTESELAAVIAHEIAHIKLEHFARFRARNKYNDLLAIGGVILAGVSKNSEVSQALFSSSLAGGLQLGINFTRSHEVEADNYGLKLLKQSKFDDFAMADFFAKLKDNPDAIEYIRTHPLSKNRVTNNFVGHREESTSNSFYYQVLKAKLHSTFTPESKEVRQYIQAYAHFTKNQFQQTITTLNDVNTQQGHNLSKILKARALAKVGKLSQALQLLGAITHTHRFLQQYVQAESYMVNTKYEKAKRILKTMLYQAPNVYVYQLLADINLQQSDTDRYYYNQGRLALLQGKTAYAKQHFLRAQQHTQDQDLFDILSYKISQLETFND
jgi:predicted Zn-dependent protease